MNIVEIPHWIIRYDDRGAIVECVSDPEFQVGGGWPAMTELAIAILQHAPGVVDPDVRVVFNGGAPRVAVDPEGRGLLNVNDAYIRAMAILRAAREVDEAHEQIGGKP